MSATQAAKTEKGILDMDFYVPAFDIFVGGKKLDKELKGDIIDISYTDNLESLGSFSFNLNNWDMEKGTFKYLDFEKSPFKVGSEIEIWMGYAGNLKKMLYGEIISLEPNFSQSDYLTLSVRGLNVLHRLRQKQETHFYKNRTDGYIAKQIAGRLNLEEGNIKDGNVHKFIVQQNRYDIIFLLERARRIGYEVSVTGDGELNFEPSTDTTKKKYILEWGKSLIHFRPTLSMASQVEEVVVKGWDPEKKKPITGKANRGDLITKGLGRIQFNEFIEPAFRRRTEIIVDRPIADKSEADQLAKEKLEQIAKEMVTGEGSTIGLPDLRAGNLIEIKNLGKSFSGEYYVTGTSHTIGDNGYITRFNVRREETTEKP